jgi:hypothetical protein
LQAKFCSKSKVQSSRFIIDGAGAMPMIWLGARQIWSLQSVMLRRDFFTKEIRRLLRGGEMVADPSAALGMVGL